jgi:hypothetical protein
VTTPRTATDVAANAGLSPEARLLLTPGLSAATYFDTLVRQHHYPDAVRYAVHLLELPRAIWWGALCIRDNPLSPAEIAALTSIVQWLRTPSDSARRTVADHGKPLPVTTAIALLCRAVFFSGGSISTPQAAEVPPPAGMAATLTGQAILTLLRSGPPSKQVLRFQQYLALAVDVQKGRNLWNG